MGNNESSRSDEDAPSIYDTHTPRLYELATLVEGQWPILYSPFYNIYFMGLEKTVAFDNKRWKRVCRYLVGKNE